MTLEIYDVFKLWRYPKVIFTNPRPSIALPEVASPTPLSYSDLFENIACFPFIELASALNGKRSSHWHGSYSCLTKEKRTKEQTGMVGR